MKSYRGSLKVAATVVDAVFSVDEETLEASTGGESLGTWPLHTLEVADNGDAVHLVLDGENVIAKVIEHEAFVQALVPPRRKRARHSRKRSERQPSNLLAKLRHVMDPETWRGWLSQRVFGWVVASVVVVGVAGLALFATRSFGMILVLIGMVGLVVAALAVSEELTAFGWIPGNFSEMTILAGGIVLMVVGGSLMWIS
jgi:hypothetical protein